MLCVDGPPHPRLPQLLVGRLQRQLLVHLQLLGQVVDVAQLLAQLLVLHRQVGRLAGGVLLPLLRRLRLLLQRDVGRLQVLDLWRDAEGASRSRPLAPAAAVATTAL